MELPRIEVVGRRHMSARVPGFGHPRFSRCLGSHFWEIENLGCLDVGQYRYHLDSLLFDFRVRDFLLFYKDQMPILI